jgi:hypothetical protein
VYLVGSGEKMGNWDADKSTFRLNWSEGHIWRATFKLAELDKSHEFKFIIRKGGNVDRWENGANHMYELSEVEKLLYSDSIRKQIESGLSNEIEIRTETFLYKFNRKTHLMQVHANWR